MASLALARLGHAAATPEPFVRPGALITFLDTYCTMNFVFKSSEGHTYTATAGHCLLEAQGSATWTSGNGIPISDANGVRIGESVAAADDGHAIDIGLIRLDAGVTVDPQMLGFGGPTGILRGVNHEPEVVNMYGQSEYFRAQAPARQLLAIGGYYADDLILVTGAVAPGDSGAPTTDDDGKAVGIISGGGLGVGIPDEGPPAPGNTFVVRLAPQLKMLRSLLGFKLRLLTAPDL